MLTFETDLLIGLAGSSSSLDSSLDSSELSLTGLVTFLLCGLVTAGDLTVVPTTCCFFLEDDDGVFSILPSTCALGVFLAAFWANSRCTASSSLLESSSVLLAGSSATIGYEGTTSWQQLQ